MSLVIRLRKPGKTIKRRTHYKIVVDERRSKKDGRFIEQIGFYNPALATKLLEIDLVKYRHWVGQGAKPTPTVKGLAKRYKRTQVA